MFWRCRIAAVLAICVLISWTSLVSSITRVRSKANAGEVLQQSAIVDAVKDKITSFEAAKIPLDKRVLVLYHVGVVALDNSMDVIVNNLKIFKSAVLSHIDATNAEALYIFNILSGEGNPFFRHIPCHAINVICVQLEHEAVEFETVVDFETHKDLVDKLGDDVLLKFKTVLFLNHEARGPFDRQNNGEWLKSFTGLIDQPNKGSVLAPPSSANGGNVRLVSVSGKQAVVSTKPIGAVSTGISCESEPRILTYAFALASNLVSKAFLAVSLYAVEESQYHNRTELLGAVMTAHLLQQGVTLATLVQQARFGGNAGVASAAAKALRANIYNDDGDGTDGAKYEAKFDPNSLEQPGNQLANALLAHNGGEEDNERRLAAKKPSKTSITTAQKAPVVATVDPVGTAIYNNKCIVSMGTVQPTTNPLLWCGLQPTHMLFVRFGGAVLRTPGILCDDAVKSITAATVALATNTPDLRLRLPETLYGGPLRDLYRQYSREHWQWHSLDAAGHSSGDKNGQATTSTGSSSRKSYSSFNLFGSTKSSSSSRKEVSKVTNYDADGGEKVCFLVRSASVHSMKQAPGEPPSKLVKMDIKLLVQTLLSQVNPHWRAYFLVTDEKPFQTELTAILSSYADSRLQFLDIPMAYRPAFTVIDAGYTATDYALNLLFGKPECKFISVSNADNAYGSHIVDNVLHARKDAVSGKPADMVLAPLDSRNFAEQDYMMRAQLRGGKTGGWRERCVGVETSLRLQLFVYTIQTLPIVGRVDLAAVFFDTARWRQENLFFSNFSDALRFPCKGCQDGYLTEALVTQRFWSYVQLPIDGMQSMVFHGPSPTLCIASGNVWFDFPEVNKLGCVSHRAVGQLYPSPLYDFSRFYDPHSSRVCLRLSQKGFWNRTASIIT